MRTSTWVANRIFSPRISTLIENVTCVELPTTAYWYAVGFTKDKPAVPTMKVNIFK
jgi:hypothetical protein